MKIYSIVSTEPKCIKCCQDRAEGAITEATKYKLQKSLDMLKPVVLPWECFSPGCMDPPSGACCTHLPSPTGRKFLHLIC